MPAWPAERVIDVTAGGSEPLSLESPGADAALIAVDLGDSAVNAVRVTAAHPDSAICVVSAGSSSSELEVELTAAARASFVVVIAPARPVRVDATERATDFSSSVIVHTAEGLTISGPSAGITEYDSEAWGGIGLTTPALFPSQPAPSLVLMDWESQATFVTRLAHRPAGAALAWVGEAP